MKLITADLRKKFPKLGATADTPATDVQVIAKYFSIGNDWTWYATEFDGDDLMFGMVHGWENELGYFSLSELESLKIWGGVPAIERDLYWQPLSMAELIVKLDMGVRP